MQEPPVDALTPPTKAKLSWLGVQVHVVDRTCGVRSYIWSCISRAQLSVMKFEKLDAHMQAPRRLTPAVSTPEGVCQSSMSHRPQPPQNSNLNFTSVALTRGTSEAAACKVCCASATRFPLSLVATKIFLKIVCCCVSMFCRAAEPDALMRCAQRVPGARRPCAAQSCKAAGHTRGKTIKGLISPPDRLQHVRAPASY